MFIEMASYVGDTLSYYMDEQFKESMLSFAEEKKTIYEIAQGYGYKPKQSSPSTAILDVFQTVPAAGSGDNAVPDEDYWQKVRALCDKYNILLALDEVQTGFGRTGNNFAHQLYGIKPDLMGCGKAAGGGILPVSFVSGRDDVIKVLTPGSEGSTFGGYPLACVVSIYAMKSLIDENLAQNANIRGRQLMSHYEDIMSEFPDKIKEVRGKGLLTAFEMHNNRHLDGHKVSVNLLKGGVYAKETHHSIVRIAPALTIEAWQIDEIADAIRNVVKDL